MSTSFSKTSSVLCRPLFLAKFLLPETSQALSALIDSGADANLIDEGLVSRLGIKRVPLAKSVPAQTLDSHLLGMVTHQTEPVKLLMSGNHRDSSFSHSLLTPHSCDPRIPLAATP